MSDKEFKPTTLEDVRRALYAHILKCKQCGAGSVPVPNEYKCATGKRLAAAFVIR